MASSGHGSRLQKLLHLVENADSEATKKAASRQICEICKSNPAQLPSILRKVQLLVYHKSWETRTAAAEAVGVLAEHFVQHSALDVAEAAGVATTDVAGISLDALNLLNVLQHGTPLVASGGQEYDLPDELGPAGDRLKKQRAALNKRLGLDGPLEGLMNAEDLVGDEDIVVDVCTSRGRGKAPTQSAASLLSSMPALSARELNKLKRKARAQSSSTAQAPKDSSAMSGPTAQSNMAGAQDDGAGGDEEEWSSILSGAWPFQRMADKLCVDMLASYWEVRHGALAALRELLAVQAGAAAVEVPAADETSGWMVPGTAGKRRLGAVSAKHASAALAANRRWLGDCVIFLLCVLALDRFADYVDDQMVAPVRETAAQALGLAVRPLPLESAEAVLGCLQQLAGASNWQARHGAMLGMKYLLAAQQDAVETLLPRLLPDVMAALQGGQEDVAGAAADCLALAVPALLRLDARVVGELQRILWELLSQLDELSPATGSVMDLLGHLYTNPASTVLGMELVQRVPRLWPFLRHLLPSVRLAALQCLQRLAAAAAAAGAGSGGWLGSLLGPLLHLVFQNLVLEDTAHLLQATLQVWHVLLAAAEPKQLLAALGPGMVEEMMAIAATPAGCTVRQELLLLVNAQGAVSRVASRPSKRIKLEPGVCEETGACSAVVGAAGSGSAERLRLQAAEALAALWSALPPGEADTLVMQPLLQLLQQHSASARTLAALTIAAHLSSPAAPPEDIPRAVVPLLLQCLAAAEQQAGQLSRAGQPYQELLAAYRHMQQALLAVAAHTRQPLATPDGAAVEALTGEGCLAALAAMPAVAEGSPGAGAQQLALASAAQVAGAESALQCSLGACLAAALVRSRQLPDKLNAVVQPLMLAVRREQEASMQQVAATALSELVLLLQGRDKNPTPKVLQNLCIMACTDVLEMADPTAATAVGNGTAKAGRKKEEPAADADLARQAVLVMRRGSEMALRTLATRLGADLFDTAPGLWQSMSIALALAPDQGIEAAPSAEAQSIASALHLVAVIGPVVDASLLPRVLQLLPGVVGAALHDSAALRACAARCAATLAAALPQPVLPPLLSIVLPMLADGVPEQVCRGGVEVVAAVVGELGLALVPYVAMMVVPLMRCMNHPSTDIRTVASSCFGLLVALLPLARSSAPPPGLDSEQLAALHKDSAFLMQLLDNKQAEHYELPMTLAVTPRHYQQEGINWLAFLRRFGLHGVLADDMGLGKTLQATVSMAAAAMEQLAGGGGALASLVVCPSTLVGHWAHEVSRYVAPEVLQPWPMAGSSQERAGLQRRLPAGSIVVIMSYEALRSDASWVAEQRWLYAVLDEGHVIRTAKSKLAQAAKSIVARHRLILSGTPIQNSAVELWSLFDFLMPGFLGSERAFNATYGKAVQAGRGQQRGSKEASAAFLALNQLHKRVMPFVLRRTKQAVLTELPPKIIQDVYCQAHPLQLQLFEDFAKTADTGKLVGATAREDGAGNVLAALVYLRKLCTHPLMVLDWQAPQHRQAVEQVMGLSDQKATLAELRRLEYSPKLLALQELLLQSGIIAGDEAEEPPDTPGAGHRFLVFAQMKSALDLVESLVLAPAGISYLRLDGSVEASARFGIVQRFNSDPTIDVLLLTTQVGGLGLNLTSADTVVFLEHDWNPMKDLQAMDRAHRLGQTRTVNVYRLIVAGTLEEKIMGLQQFKLEMAAAVVNQDNVAMSSMDTAQLLDLFAPPKATGPAATGGAPSAALGATGEVPGAGKSGLAAMLDSLGGLWDEQQYESEFNVQSYMSKLAKPTA